MDSENEEKEDNIFFPSGLYRQALQRRIVNLIRIFIVSVPWNTEIRGK